jgi:PAS domain S-box-containing protein
MLISYLGQIKNWAVKHAIQLILGSLIVVVVVFISFDLQAQRDILEGELLAKGKSLAINGAETISYGFEEGIANGSLTEADVFDTDYQPVPGTIPQKYHTRYDSFTDANFQAILDKYLEDQDVTYAVAQDVNGYLPTHNTVFSQPLSGDLEVDLLNNRTKRLFNDTVGLNASHNTQPFLMQNYPRDTGEVLWDISAPIFVNGKHWGSFRVGISLANVQVRQTVAVQRVFYPSLLLVVGMILVTFLVSGLHRQLANSNLIMRQEVEQRKNIQKLLARENELLNITLMSMGDSVITTDQNEIITSFNNGAEQLTGYSQFDAIGKPLGEIFQILDAQNDHKADPILVYLYQHDAKEQSGLNSSFPTLLNKNKERVLVACEVFPLKADQDTVLGYVLIGRDMTEKYQVETQTMLSQKMEAIGRLASGIAHEINTPIQYVGDNINYIQRAFTQCVDVLSQYRDFIVTHGEKVVTAEDEEEAASLWKLKKIEYYRNEVPKAIGESLDGIERVRKIVVAIREFSHPSEKEKKLADINQGILTTITISRNEWKYCAEMEADLDPNLPMVNCQIDEINQVILNMIVNAAHAIQDVLPENFVTKGTIRIATRRKKDNVVITVQDSGCGIPEGIQNRIFDPFFTTKDVNKGTGQGLAIAHNIIVNKHGGRISVQSKVGEGTTFEIEIPIESPQKRQDDPHAVV